MAAATMLLRARMLDHAVNIDVLIPLAGGIWALWAGSVRGRDMSEDEFVAHQKKFRRIAISLFIVTAMYAFVRFSQGPNQ